MLNSQLMNNDLKYIPLNLIDGPTVAMRDDLNEEALQDLVQSIREAGVITPLTLKPKGDRYEVVAGARRRMAAIYAGLSEVPAVVRAAGARETALIKMHENLVREDVDPVSEGRFIADTMAELGLDEAAFADQIKRSVEYVRARLAVHAMPDYIKEYLRTGAIGLTVALLLAQVDEEPRRKNWVDDAVRSGMSITTAKYALAVWQAGQEAAAAAPAGTPPPEVPMELPTILWPCAKCGGQGKSEDMVMVRIHKEECVSDDIPAQ